MTEIGWTWPWHGEVRVEDGVLREGLTDSTSYYHPFDRDNLPNAFAKVHDEQSAVRFAETYGLLGLFALKERAPAQYQREAPLFNVDEGLETPYLIFPPEEPQREDPLWWILAHAKSVKAVLRLIAKLYRDDYPAVEETLTSMRPESFRQTLPLAREQPVDLLGGIWGAYGFVAGKNPVGEVIKTPYTAGGQDPWRVHVTDLITTMVNANTKNVHWALGCGDGKMLPYLKARALVEAIWKLTGDMAALSLGGHEAPSRRYVGIRICQECGTPFKATHRRQRFCPPVFERRSLCGQRHRMRRWRNTGAEGAET